MKKRIAKIVTLICTLTLAMVCVLALVACGGTTYTYSGTDVKMTGDNMGGMDMSGTMSTMYDNLFKGSTITVSDSKVVWKLSDQESSMEVKKDGDKYVLSGDYVDQLEQGISAGLSGSGVAVTYDFEMYGTETDAGFDIVIATSSTSSITGTSITVGATITVSFVK